MSALVPASALSPRLLHGVPDDADPHLRLDGTAVVVDISGFTTLSEQLAAAGREGTEQLIATLSRIFSVLLPVTDDGGDIVKFAGDALFILFTGDHHARHAVHAAWNMNRVLTAIGDVHLPAARAKLRMSVGVHTGTFDVLLTGDENVSAVLAGRDTSRVLQLQDAAAPGRILVSDETAADLPAKQVAADPDTRGAHRLLRAGSVAASTLMALSMGRTEATDRFLPRAFAQRPDLLGSEPDHRWVAIAFIQVSGVPDEPQADDVERMNRLTRLVEEAAADTGVTLLDVDPAQGGYRYFLTAGAPTAAEDPEGRLLTAALRVVSAAQDYSVRAGVTSGRVFSGFVGATFRQTYTVMGDPTNLAARLTSRAEPGTVLAARLAVQRSGRSFETVDRGTISVKGKKQEIDVVEVTGQGGGATLDARRTPFVGRREELARLRNMLTDAAAGLGGVITVSGPAGIGKTRLLDHALQETPLVVLHARGDRYGANTPYRTLQSLLRPLLGIPSNSTPVAAGEILCEAVEMRTPHLIAWLPLIAPAVRADVANTDEADALDDAFRAERAHGVLQELITLLAVGPGCLLIEDAQWVDPASAAVLTEVVAQDATHAIFVSRRADAGGFDPDGERLPLGGLPDDDASDLIEAVAGRRMLPADLRPLISRAGGNPLYTIELAAALSDGDGALGIEQLVGERIDGLSEPDRASLRRASVLGARIPLSLYIKCVGMPLLSSGLSGFLELSADSVAFRSELFRDVAYAQLNFQTRRELHRAAAAVITADAGLGGASRDAMLTVHFEAAGDWDAAREAATRAAVSAERSFALEEAVRAYRTAVEAARHSKAAAADVPGLLEALGRVSVAGGWATEGLVALTEARRLAADTVQRARLDRERAFALNVLGRPADALKTLRSARASAQRAGEEGHTILAAIAITEAGVDLRQARWTEAKGRAQEAIALLEAMTLTDADKRVLADAYRYHDIAASELEGDTAMVHLQRALELYDDLGDWLSKSKVLSLLGVRAYYRGDWSTSAHIFAEAESEAERAGDAANAAIGAANLAEVLVDQGRVDEARPLIRRARRSAAGSGNTYLVAFVDGFEGRADLRAGDPAAARRAFTRAADGFASLGESDSLADVLVRRVEADLDLGDLIAAEAAVTEIGEDAVHGPARSRLLCVRARLSAAQGRADDAVRLARQAVDAAGDARFERALALILLAHWSADGDARAEAEAMLAGLGVTDIADLLDAPSAGDVVAALHHSEAETTPS